MAVDDFSLTPGSAPTPSITVSSAGPLNVGSTNSGTPSTATATYDVSGSNLTAGITVTAPTNFEVSTSSTTGFAGSLTLPQSSGTVATTAIYVRLSGSGTPGTVSGNVTNTSTNATTRSVAVTGTVNSITPTITLSAAALPAFTTVAGVPSAERSYQVSGTNLTAVIEVTAPTGYEVSLTSGSGFGPSVQVPQTGGTASSTVYVRLSGSGSGTVAGNLLHQSAGAADVTKAVTGTVVAEPTTQPSVSTGTITATTAVLNVTGGNGSNRLLVIRQTSTGAIVPVDQTTYTDNAAFGNSATGTTTGTGNYVVISGTATTVTVTGLSGSTAYTAEVYAYNEAAAAGFENYLTTTPGTTSFTTPAAPQPGQLVISQVYGAGGNSGAAYRNDYVELFNRSTSTVSLSGYSIAYFSSGGSPGGTVALTGSVDPGKYYLIRLSGGSTGAVLPTADATASIMMSTTDGRVDLLAGATLLDRVGFGSANSYEGTAAAPSPSAANAIFRAGSGCTDTDDNRDDFAAAAAGPRNSASAANPCNAPSLVAAPTTLSLTAQSGQTATGSYTLTGSNLGNAGAVSISSASPAILVSVNGSPFAQTATATANASGVLSQLVNVQYTAPGTSGTASATISNDITVGATTASAPVTVNTTATPVPATEPTAQPTVVVSNITPTTADIIVAGGDGTNRLVVIRPTSATAVAPTDGTTYTASPAYGGATTGFNNYVVLNGAATTVTVTGLTQLTDYTVEVYAYNGAGGSENYLATAPGTASFTTTAPPALTWDGGGDGSSFIDALNWVGDVAPTTGSSVLFDHSVVTGTYSVNLPTGSPSALSLSSLIINPGGGAPITVTLPSTNNTVDYLRLTRSTAALVIYSGGTFVSGTASASGTPVDLTTGADNFIIYNGGAYVHQNARSVSSLLDHLNTTLAGTETGAFVYNTASSYTLSLSNRTYNSLVLRTTNAGGGSFTGGGNGALVIRGNLDIGSNVTFTPTLSADINLAGDLINGGNFRFVPASGTNRRFLVLNGTTTQTISGNPLTAGTGGTSYLGNNVALRLSNSAGFTLATPVTINGGASSAAARGGLDLAGGVMNTTSTNLLTLNTNATILNTAGGSYINGPLARTVASGTTGGVLFPIGKGPVYRPLILTPTTLANTTTFTAEQHEGRPTAGAPLNGGLTRVSQVRQFTVTPSPVPATGEFEGTISLSFDADDQVTDPADATLVIAKNSGSGWENIGRSANTGAASGGAYVVGTLTSAPFTSFSDFALASTSNTPGLNPLPVELTSFTAKCQDGGALLSWTTAQEKNSARFEVLRSTDGGREFGVIGTVQAAGHSTTTRHYTFVDRTLPAGQAYYRLRSVDTDGSRAESAPVALSCAGTGKLAVAAYPNPVQDELRLEVAADQAEWRLLNLLGQPLRSGKVQYQTTVDLRGLPAGQYQLEVRTATQRVVRALSKVN